MLLETFASPWRKWRNVNCTDTSFDSTIPKIIEPVGTGITASDLSVVDLSGGQSSMLGAGGPVQNNMMIEFFGAGADDTTFDARLVGWSPLQTDRAAVVSDETQIWIPTVLFQVNVTLSTQVGVAARAVIETDRFADTIVLVTGTANAGVGIDIRSPANNTIASLMVDLRGFMKAELIFDLTGATNANALYRLL